MFNVLARPLSLKPTSRLSSRGFTLIEIMVVLALIGVMVSLVQFSFQGNAIEKDIKQSSLRFQGVFTVAAEYGMLNNVELGVMFDEDSYQFLGFDGVKWQALEQHDALKRHTLPNHLKLQLDLEGLPIDENALLDVADFTTEDDGLFVNNEAFKDSDEKKLTPQIFILSGGEISPFSVTFSAKDIQQSDDHVAYKVSGTYSLPLVVTGPIVHE